MKATIAIHLDFEGAGLWLEVKEVEAAIIKALPHWLRVEDTEAFTEENWNALMSGGIPALRKGA